MDNDNATRPQDVGWLSQMGWWVLILTGAAGTRFYHLGWAALWYDEAFSVLMSEHSPGMLFEVSKIEVHPPLYYLMLKGWIWLFGNGLDCVRALSACAGVVTVGLGMWLTAIIANRRAALLTGIMLALLPFAVRYSQEVRMYALLGVWMTGATIALVYWVKQPRKYRYLAAYAVLVAAGLYTHYFVFTVIAAHWLYLMTVREPMVNVWPWLVLRPSWWVANLAAALMFLPWLPILILQVSNPTTNFGWIPPVNLYSIPSLFWQYLTLVNGVQLPAILYWGLTIALLALSVYCIVSDDRTLRLSGLLVICVWGPILMMFFVSFRLPVFYPRYLMFSALSLPMLVAVTIERLTHDQRWIAGVAFALVVGLEATGLRNLYDPQRDIIDDAIQRRNERIDVIAGELNAQLRPGDQIIALNYFWFPSLLYYLKGHRPLLYAPGGEDCTLHGYCRMSGPFEPGRDDIYIATLDRLLPQTRRVWLVDGLDSSDVGLTLPCHWQLLDTLVAGGNRLRVYEINAGQPMSTAKPCPAP